MNDEYQSIMYLKYEKSKRYPHMTVQNRAAQFQPFAALITHADVINETSRYVDTMIELSDDEINSINDVLMNIDNSAIYSITYFFKDTLKNGGIYKTISNQIKKIDLDNNEIIFTDKSKIKISNLLKISKIDL